jgi:hypothetical protein
MLDETTFVWIDHPRGDLKPEGMENLLLFDAHKGLNTVRA